MNKSIERFKNKLKEESTMGKRKKTAEETEENRRNRIKTILSGEHPEM